MSGTTAATTTIKRPSFVIKMSDTTQRPKINGTTTTQTTPAAQPQQQPRRNFFPNYDFLRNDKTYSHNGGVISVTSILSTMRQGYIDTLQLDSGGLALYAMFPVRGVRGNVDAHYPLQPGEDEQIRGDEQASSSFALLLHTVLERLYGIRSDCEGEGGKGSMLPVLNFKRTDSACSSTGGNPRRPTGMAPMKRILACLGDLGLSETRDRLRMALSVDWTPEALKMFGMRRTVDEVLPLIGFISETLDIVSKRIASGEPAIRTPDTSDEDVERPKRRRLDDHASSLATTDHTAATSIQQPASQRPVRLQPPLQHTPAPHHQQNDSVAAGKVRCECKGGPEARYALCQNPSSRYSGKYYYCCDKPKEDPTRCGMWVLAGWKINRRPRCKCDELAEKLKIDDRNSPNYGKTVFTCRSGVCDYVA